MTFAKPEMLWLLMVTAPLLTWFLVWAWRKRQHLIGQFVQSRLLAQLTVGVSRWRLKARLVLLGVAAVLILLALARPQLGFAWEEVRQRGLDIFVAVDTSRSMLAGDVSPSRLARAKLAALDLMKLARSDRLALIGFAGNAFLQCPLTLDDNAFQQSVNLLDVGLLPQGGTAIGEAIQVALAALKESGDNHKVMVLFTDGEDHDAGAVDAALKAGEAGLRIFTVGVGTATGDRLRLVDEQGRTTYVMDEQGKPVVSKLNQDLLREIAAKTGGDYLPLMGADPMQTLYEARLAPLPKSDLTARLLRQYHERYQWPLALAILLLTAELFLPQRRKVFRPEAGAAARTSLPKLVAALLAVLPTSPAQASSRSALRAYAEGRFGESREEYERLLEKKTDDPRLQFNAGTAALRTEAFAEATNYLGSATRSSDPDLLKDVYYNLGNALFRLGERASQPAETLTNWEASVQHYDSVLKLNPQDTDARFNRELVTKKIELLRQQMARPQAEQDQGQPNQDPQQQSDKSDQSKTSDPSDSAEPPPQPSEPSNQNQDQQNQQNQQPGQPSDSENQAGAGEKERQDQSSPERTPDQDPPKPGEENQPRPQSEEQKPSASSSAQGQDGGTTNATDAAGTSSVLGQMTPEQARRLLEAARVEERAWQPVPPPRNPRNATRIRRDW